MRKLKKYQSTIVQWLGLILVVLIFGIWSEGNLFSRYNINTMLETVTPLLVVCVGMAFIFAHGGMNISSGAVIRSCWELWQRWRSLLYVMSSMSS